MRGMALEGGGARGAYHIGVFKALTEKGYELDGFVGTSIGAINAALFAQGELDRAIELWSNISVENLFDMDTQQFLELSKDEDKRPDTKLLFSVQKLLLNLIKDRGISTDKMRMLLEQYIDEDKIRSSGKDFGLVTISLSDRVPRELMLEDIPQGKLLSYIMASASFPGFKPEKIDGKMFLDGALYNNCPFNLLMDKGYDEIIAVRTFARGIVRKIDDTQRIKLVAPNKHLGNTMQFSPEGIAANVELGYCDGLRFAENTP